MKRRSVHISLVLCLAAQPWLCGELPSEVVLLARVRRQAVHDLSRIPNYTCLETVERAGAMSVQSSLHRLDLARVEVAEVNHQELFAWPGEKTFGSHNLQQMIPGGLTSTGEFMAHARSVFEGGAARFHFAGNSMLHGRPAIRYDYSIAAPFSGYRITTQGHSEIVAMRGSFWASSESLALERLTVEAIEIPREVGVLSALTILNYSPVTINEQRYVLPQSALISVVKLDGSVERNTVAFTHCRQYQTESVLRFDLEENAGRRGINDAVLDESPIPKGLTFRVSLLAPLDSKTASIGDLIRAEVREDVHHKGRVVVPSGARLDGRIRALEPVSAEPGDSMILAIEFERLSFTNRRARFWASLHAVEAISGVAAKVLKKGAAQSHNYVPTQVPGVGTLRIEGTSFVLPTGFEMRWVSLAP